MRAATRGAAFAGWLEDVTGEAPLAFAGAQNERVLIGGQSQHALAEGVIISEVALGV